MLATDLPLTAADRCDRCPAAAQTRWTKGSAALLLCGHHATQNESKLLVWADSLHDERSAHYDREHATTSTD